MNCVCAKFQTLFGGLPVDPILASGLQPEFYFGGIIHLAWPGLDRSNKHELVHSEQLEHRNVADIRNRRVGQRRYHGDS